MTEDSKDGFVLFIKQHHDLINSLCFLYVSEAHRSDLRQEILLQLWKAFPSYRRESAAGTWVYRVALNTILGWKRKQSRQLRFSPISGQALKHPAAPQAGFDDDQQQFLYALDQLTDLNKAIVVLHLEGYSHAEIAGILGLTATNVSTRFGRIKKHLKKIFKRLAHGIK